MEAKVSYKFYYLDRQTFIWPLLDVVFHGNTSTQSLEQQKNFAKIDRN